jgi:hypothetical protein
MSGIIAANRLIQPTFELQAEGIDGFYMASQFEGSLSADVGDGEHVRLLSTKPDGYVGEMYVGDDLYTGPLKIRGNLNTCKSLSFNANSNTNNGLIKFDISEFAKMPNLEQAGVSHPTVYPTGDISSLPKKLKSIFFSRGRLEGNIKDISKDVKAFVIATDNNLTGDMLDLPLLIEAFNVGGNNSITGNFSVLPESIKEFSFATNHGSFSSNFLEIKEGLQSFSLNGNAINIAGDLAELPTSVYKFTIAGNAKITGDISSLNSKYSELAVYCENSITGDIAYIPPFLYYFVVEGSNTLFGNIEMLSSNLSTFQVKGFNTITGDIVNISNSIDYILLYGNNTVYGDVQNLNPLLKVLDIRGENQMYGNVTYLPENIIEITITGNNTLYGDLGSIKRMSVIRIAGYATCHYISTVWPSPMYEMSYTPKTTGLTEAQVDQLIIDLSFPDWDAFRKIDLRGVNAPRTSASDAAILVLQTKSVTVLTN